MYIDYEKKARIMSEGLHILAGKVKSAYWREVTGQISLSKHPLPIQFAEQIDEDMKKTRYDDWHEANKINHATFERTRRLRQRIENFIQNENGSLFLTLTFNDDTLEKTNGKTRRKYVTNYLKSLGVPYVANIDYGAKYHREHYHAVVSCSKIDYKPWHEYGAIKGEIIRYRDSTSTKLGKYVSKLTNHAIKETTKRCCIIYSR